MCRLFGLRANKAVDLSFSMLGADTPFRGLGKKNPDGWGMGWYEGSQPKVSKYPICASDKGSGLRQLARRQTSNSFICHVRKMTTGDVRTENCHPFRYKNWLFAHNGSVELCPLFTMLNNEHQSALEGDTDSEVYFHWLLQGIEQAGDTIQGIRLALPQVHAKSALNFILSDGEHLYAYRYTIGVPRLHELFYLERHSSALLAGRSTRTGAMLEIKKAAQEQAVLVCSERLTTGEAWTPIGIGELLIISPDLTCRAERMTP